MRTKLVILILSLLVSLPATAAVRWDVMDTPMNRRIEMLETEQAQLGSSDNYIYLTVHQRVEVKVFTILGQMVVSQTLDPGNYRLPMTSRGIYIVKIGSSTHRVVI